MKFYPQGYWEGQVAPNQTENDTDVKGHGFRVKVRIYFSSLPGGKGTDSIDSTIKNKDLRFASILLPATHGSANRLSSGLRGGEYVCGYFLDSEGQKPRITGVLPRSENSGEILSSVAESQGTTGGKRLDTYSQKRANNPPTSRTGGVPPTENVDSAAATGLGDLGKNIFGIIKNFNNSIKMK